MTKKCLVLILLGVVGLCFIACSDPTNLSVDRQALILKEGDSYVLNVQTSDAAGVRYESADHYVATVDQTGRIEALSEGQTTITVTAVSDVTKTVTITVTVRKQVQLDVDATLITMVVDDTLPLFVTSNEGVTFTSDQPTVVTVNDAGHLTAHIPGESIITVRSAYDDDVFVTIHVHVFSKAEHILIEGAPVANVGTPHLLSAAVSPNQAHEAVHWISDDPLIATVDSTGVVTAHAPGSVVIRAISIHDDTVFAVKTLTTIKQILVDLTASARAEQIHKTIRYVAGVNLFDDLNTALHHATAGSTVILMPGTYADPYVLETDNLTIEGDGAAHILGALEVKADHIIMKSLVFMNTATVQVFEAVEGFQFVNNAVNNITLTDRPFLTATNIVGLTITNNQFNQLAHDALLINGVLSGQVTIEMNTFNDVRDAVVLDVGTAYSNATEIIIVRNAITQMRTGLDITMHPNETAILAYARFNSIQDATEKLVRTNADTPFDFTLNHWGFTTINLNDFTHLNAYDLRGFYTSAQAIPSVANYNPALPAKILFVDPIEELIIGASYQLEYEILPRELNTDRIRFITSNPDVLGVNQAGLLTPLRSGSATITVRSALNITINSTTIIHVTTTPGVALLPSLTRGGLLVGESFTLDAEPFPYTFATEPLLFASSDDTRATIDGNGVVSTHAPGVVTFTVAFANQPDVFNTFTVEIYESLDETNLMDLLTMAHMTTAIAHTWTAYGVGFDYVTTRYESVSRYYFEPVLITEMIIPVFYAIRPGSPMAAHPQGITPFNPFNVYWVVIHDTANTNPGSGALAHANYLYNSSVTSTELWTSWHYTIDDRFVYRHIPETERAFHAGDGSVLPGQSSQYLGGGNRNGVGIEMAINQDGDMYRTWQRTAKLSADIMVRFNLPRTHLTYHQDFSGKLCPRTMITAGLRPVFEEFVDIEYQIRSEFPDAHITMQSHHPDYLDNSGRIIQMPQRAMSVSYTITVIQNGIETQRVFTTYLPGTDR